MAQDTDPVGRATIGSAPKGEGQTIVDEHVEHIRHPLDQGERDVREGILRMGALAEAQILAAIDALVSHDVSAAEVVKANDRAINEAQRAITSQIATTIATQAPVARDLRLLLALDHVSYEIERIGDHASSVAKQVRHLAPYPPLKEYVDLPRMGQLGAQLLREILRALLDVNVEEARRVARMDDEIDVLYHRSFDQVLEIMRADSETVERGARLILASHYLERIGDRVTNIAEDVVFLATGQVEDLND
ncbi:MAG TPA: phosphate signaling complex protein PhoU [Candidatus Limnocylindrales bacterium]|nr:phosphate signaling complex protein PhoU [Candidatus Limnocylindrales bacterium]